MILRFSSTIQTVSGCTGASFLVVTPIAGVDTLFLHAETSIVREDGTRVTCAELRPGLLINVCGEDDGGNHMKAHRLVLSSSRNRG